MTRFMPKTFSAREVQRSYRHIFDQAQIEPVVILTNNQPDVVIMGVDQASQLMQKAQEAQFDGLLQAIAQYRK